MKEAAKKIFDALPGCYLILLPDAPRFTIYDANEAYLKVTQKTRDIIGKPLFDIFPDNPASPLSSGVKNLTASLMAVLNTNKRHQMPIQRYDITTSDKEHFEIRFWKPLNIPVHDEFNRIIYIVHCVEDVTKQLNVGSYLRRRYKEIQNQISEAVITTQETERLGLSRELHDNVLQLLNTGRLYLERAMQTRPLDEALVQSGMEMVTNAMEDLRKLASVLVQSANEELQLSTLIEKLLGDVENLRHIVITKTIDINESLVEPKVKLAISRIIQELLSNVMKHSKAKNLWISLSITDNGVKFIIRDDGVGFDAHEKTSGLGLRNIKSRISELNGEIAVDSTPGRGTQVEVRIPG